MPKINKNNNQVDKSAPFNAKIASNEFKLLVEALIRGLNFTAALLKKARDKGELN